jgi:hypothetical protein
MSKPPQRPPRAMPTFRAVAIDLIVVLGGLTTAVLAAKEFWKPADWFVEWVKGENYRAPGLVLIVALIVLFKSVIVAAQIKEREGSRLNPIGNRRQRRASEAESRRKK